MPVKKVVVFVHVWSVTNTDTYGGLPVRLAAQAKGAGIDIRIVDIFLGKYISFHDEVIQKRKRENGPKTDFFYRLVSRKIRQY